MGKIAKFKDYLYLNEGEPRMIEFDRKIDFENQVWYFVIADCSRLTMEKDTMGQIPFTATLELMNGDSQFSEEDSGAIFFFILALVIMVVTLALSAYLSKKDLDTAENFSNPLIVTSFALMLLVLKSYLQLFHLAVYSYNGTGIIFVRMYSTICSLFSQLLFMI